MNEREIMLNSITKNKKTMLEREGKGKVYLLALGKRWYTREGGTGLVSMD